MVDLVTCYNEANSSWNYTIIGTPHGENQLGIYQYMTNVVGHGFPWNNPYTGTDDLINLYNYIHLTTPTFGGGGTK